MLICKRARFSLFLSFDFDNPRTEADSVSIVNRAFKALVKSGSLLI